MAEKKSKRDRGIEPFDIDGSENWKNGDGPIGIPSDPVERGTSPPASSKTVDPGGYTFQGNPVAIGDELGGFPSGRLNVGPPSETDEIIDLDELMKDPTFKPSPWEGGGGFNGRSPAEGLPGGSSVPGYRKPTSMLAPGAFGVASALSSAFGGSYFDGPESMTAPGAKKSGRATAPAADPYGGGGWADDAFGWG